MGVHSGKGEVKGGGWKNLGSRLTEPIRLFVMGADMVVRRTKKQTGFREALSLVVGKLVNNQVLENWDENLSEKGN